MSGPISSKWLASDRALLSSGLTPWRPLTDPPDRLIGAVATLDKTPRQAIVTPDKLEKTVVSRRCTPELASISIWAKAYMLLKDLPRLSKASIAQPFAQVLGLDFAWIRFIPDLLCSNVTGAPSYDQRSA